MTKITVVKDDIFNIDCDCMIFSASEKLLQSKGAAARILELGDKNMYDELAAIDKCSVGRARISKCECESREDLRWAIFAVGPRYAGGLFFEDDLLRDSLSNALNITANLKTVYSNQCEEIMVKILDGLEQDLPEEVRQGYIDDVREVAEEYVDENPIKKVAVQLISIGNKGYPLVEGLSIIKRAVGFYTRTHTNLDEIVLVCHNDRVFKLLKKIM